MNTQPHYTVPQQGDTVVASRDGVDGRVRMPPALGWLTPEERRERKALLEKRLGLEPIAVEMGCVVYLSNWANCPKGE